MVVLRDMMFGNRRHFRELLGQSMEGIASNILASRLKHLREAGLISAAADPTHKQKVTYSLTEAAIQLVPALVMLGEWGRKHLPATHALSVRTRMLFDGGQPLWDEFMNELRVLHLGAKPKRRSKAAVADERGILERLDAAYDAAERAAQA